MSTEQVLREVHRERARQDEKWGEQNHNNVTWAAILGEEYGEACQETLRVKFGGKNPVKLREELIQVAAVAVVWIECLDRRL